jgi:phosphoglycolate phosphatase-like HAD superfamily hydrolase
MPEESEKSRRVTKAIKAVDKLVRDVREDVDDILLAADGVKELLTDLKDKFKKGDDTKEV